MTVETFFQLHYHLTDTERQFDLAQGIAAQRRRLKKRDVRCRSFSWFTRRLLWQGVSLLVLSALLMLVAVLLELGHLAGAMAGLCFACGVLELVLRAVMRRSYRRSWQQFQRQNDPDGCILFDAGGIREENRRGQPTHFTWQDWDVAVVTPKVIVLTFKTPVLLFFPYSEEAAVTVARAAAAFGGDLVYRK